MSSKYKVDLELLLNSYKNKKYTKTEKIKKVSKSLNVSKSTIYNHLSGRSENFKNKKTEKLLDKRVYYRKKNYLFQWRLLVQLESVKTFKRKGNKYKKTKISNTFWVSSDLVEYKNLNFAYNKKINELTQSDRNLVIIRSDIKTININK